MDIEENSTAPPEEHLFAVTSNAGSANGGIAFVRGYEKAKSRAEEKLIGTIDEVEEIDIYYVGFPVERITEDDRKI